MTRLRFPLVLAASLLVVLPNAPGDEPPIVLILAGQSNMVGQGERPALAPAQQTLPPNVELITGTQRAGAGPATTFGPELALAHELAAALPHRRFKLLKFAIGSTSIRAWAPDWSAEAAQVTENEPVGALYPRLLAFLRQHLGAEAAPPHAILWFQGERDARYAAAAADYEPRLTEFIRRLRSDLRAPDSWFIVGVVNPPYAHTAQVAATQRSLPRHVPRTRVVDSEGLGKKADRIHYDTAGQWELGRRYARELLPTLQPAAARETAE